MALQKIIYICCYLTMCSFVKAYSQAPALILKDTQTIMQQLKLAKSISSTQPDSTILLSEQALKSSKALRFSDGIADALLQMGVAYQNKNEFQHSILILQTALSYCSNSTQGREKKVRILYFTGDGYWFSNKADSAALYYYRSLDEITANNMNDGPLLLEIYSKLILLWVNLNDNYSPTSGTIDKYTESAILYFDKAALQQQPDADLRSKILLNQGHIKKMEKKYDSARIYYNDFLRLAKKNNLSPVNPAGWTVATLLNISDTYLEENVPDSAIYYANQVIAYIGIKKSEAPIYYILANYFIGKALCYKKEFTEAIKVTVTALAMAKKNNRDYAQHIAYLTLAKAYEATGQYRKACDAQNIYIILNDSLKRNSNIQSISQMEMKYRMLDSKKVLAEKELIISKKDNNIRSQRILLLSFLFVLIIVFLLYRQHISKHRIKLLKVEKEKELSHLNAMIQGEEKERSRLSRELHDGIGGLLGSIRLQLSSALKIYKIDDTAAADFSSILKLLEGAYSDLRKTAHNLMPETLQQEGLEKATSLFCNGINKSGVIEVVFETVGDIPSLLPNIELTVYRVIQELVHNILKHAGANKVFVQLAFINQRLAITVEDNGIGFNIDTLFTTEGIGLKTIKERIKSIGGTVDISSSPGEGSSIHIEIVIEDKTLKNN